MTKRNYGVCHATTLEGLIDEVNQRIEDGYEPIGGAVAGFDVNYLQAMYKKPAARKNGRKEVEYPEGFEQTWPKYPKRAGSNSKRRAAAAWCARRKEGEAGGTMVLGVQRYAKYCEATGKLGTEFVLQAATFFGPDKHYLESWDLPEPEKDVTQLPARNDDLIKWALERELPQPSPGQSWAEYRSFLLTKVES